MSMPPAGDGGPVGDLGDYLRL
ncbi:MAG: hypothetical protein QOJ50_77, partial [Cryptosporangiaceae bacterium]|nr:hypothetical protein [Cryptosporangiaceae bacterium]